jgi:hypothetical protein
MEALCEALLQVGAVAVVELSVGLAAQDINAMLEPGKHDRTVSDWRTRNKLRKAPSENQLQLPWRVPVDDRGA